MKYYVNVHLQIRAHKLYSCTGARTSAVNLPCFDRRKRLQVSCIIGLCSMQSSISGKEDRGIIFPWKKAEFVAQILEQRCRVNYFGTVEVPLILFLVRGITYCILGFHCHARDKKCLSENPKIGNVFNPRKSFLGRQLNAASHKSLEIHTSSLGKRRPLSNQKFVYIKVFSCCNTSLE